MLLISSILFALNIFKMDTSSEICDFLTGDDFCLPDGPPPLIRTETYVSPRIELKPNGEKLPSGHLLRDTWCLRGNPIFFVDHSGLAKIVEELVIRQNLYVECDLIDFLQS